MDTLIYLTDGFWREIGDQRVHSNFPMMSGGPIPIILIVSSYVYFVRYLGPKWMKQRDAMDLKWTIRIYNILMSLVNFYAFCRVSILTNFGLDYFGCKQVGRTRVDNELVNVAFLYFATKLVELLDTVFFILRKKPNQASNLHVFHHGFIAICVWIYFKVAPGGSSVLFPYLNLGVHSIMYGYYFLATFKSLHRHLWWKRHLTEAQIIQFVLSMVHFSFQGLSSCQYPPALAIIGFTFNLIFFGLFCDFYYHAYLKRQWAAKRAEQQKEREQLVAIRAREIRQNLHQTLGSSRREPVIIDENNNNNNNDNNNNNNDNEICRRKQSVQQESCRPVRKHTTNQRHHQVASC